MVSLPRRSGLLILICSALAAAVFGAWFGPKVPYQIQAELLRELREVSTIIFGIMGAWSAIVYPEKLRHAIRATEVQQIDDSSLGRFRSLMLCIVLSAAIIAIVVIMQFAAPALRQLSVVLEHPLFARGACFSFTCVLGAVQLWVIALMLVPLNEASIDARSAQEAKDALARGVLGVPRRSGTKAS